MTNLATANAKFKALLWVTLVFGLAALVPSLLAIFHPGPSFFSSGLSAQFVVVLAALSSATLVGISSLALLRSRTSAGAAVSGVSAAALGVYQMGLFGLAAVTGASSIRALSSGVTLFVEAVFLAITAAGLVWCANRTGEVSPSKPLRVLSISSVVLGLVLIPVVSFIASHLFLFSLKGTSGVLALLQVFSGVLRFTGLLLTHPYWLLGMGVSFVLMMAVLLIFAVRAFVYRWGRGWPLLGALKGALITLGLLSLTLMHLVELAERKTPAARYWMEKTLSFLMYKAPPAAVALVLMGLLTAGAVVGWTSYKKNLKGAE